MSLTHLNYYRMKESPKIAMISRLFIRIIVGSWRSGRPPALPYPPTDTKNIAKKRKKYARKKDVH